jgi:hypothetical protein
MTEIELDGGSKFILRNPHVTCEVITVSAAPACRLLRLLLHQHHHSISRDATCASNSAALVMSNSLKTLSLWPPGRSRRYTVWMRDSFYLSGWCLEKLGVSGACEREGTGS